METDNNLILSHCCWIRLLVTSMNVIHSWGIYSLGWKFDGIPGILNGIYYHLCFIGFFNGLCYELCGLLHNFMSIRLRSIIFLLVCIWRMVTFALCLWDITFQNDLILDPIDKPNKIISWSTCSPIFIPSYVRWPVITTMVVFTLV